MTTSLCGPGPPWLAAIPVLFAAYPVFAQVAAGGTSSSDEPSSTLQEVVVTAEKRTESLQSVPVPETVVSASSLGESGNRGCRTITRVSRA